MGKREVTILNDAAEAIAEVAFFIESKGLPETAKRFVDEAFSFFETLSEDIVKHRDCKYKRWENLGYSCVNYKKKYVVAYLDLSDEIIICDFISAKLIIE